MSERKPPTDKLGWALWLAERGFLIIELGQGTKSPRAGYGWLRNATNDPAKIRNMFAVSPNCNFGVCPGERGVILDLDTKNGKRGVSNLKKLTAEHSAIGPTLTVKSPSGGRHLYLTLPGGHTAVGNAHSFGADSGIDVRGAHGYTVGPGCELVAGLCKLDDTPGAYTVRDPAAPIAVAPAWLLDYLKPQGERDERASVPVVELDLPENVEKAKRYLSEAPAAISGQSGNQTAYDVACMVRDFGVSETKCAELMADGDWAARCLDGDTFKSYPWTEAELLSNNPPGPVRNAYRYGQNRSGVKADFMSLHDRLAGVGIEPEPSQPSPDDVPDDDASDGELFPAYLIGELDQIPDPAWLIRDVLPEIALAMTYGETGSLKTFIELDKALWGATGKPWAASDMHKLDGFKVARKLRTVIVAGEGARGLKRRIAAWAKRHGMATDALSILVIPVMPRFAVGADLEKLIRTIKARLPNPDHVIVDTAMWAAAGLNLNIPADSQTLLSGFKRVMLALGCSLTFVHHTGKDPTRGHLGAENLLASVDVSDCVELVEKGVGRRVIRISNKKMKDGETREPIFMEAYPEILGTDGDGRKVSSLVLRRCHGPASAGDTGDTNPYERPALAIIEENKGKPPLPTRVLASEMVERLTNADLSDGERKASVERIERWLRRAASKSLAPFAWSDGSSWLFGERSNSTATNRKRE